MRTAATPAASQCLPCLSIPPAVVDAAVALLEVRLAGMSASRCWLLGRACVLRGRCWAGILDTLRSAEAMASGTEGHVKKKAAGPQSADILAPSLPPVTLPT
jgi:hypothetical protein